MYDVDVIYIDLDDTVKDTEKYIRKVLSLNGVNEKEIVGTVYRLIDSGTLAGSLVEDCLNEWGVIPFKSCAYNAIKLLQTEYKIIFCSAYSFNREARAKKAFAKAMGCDILLCGKGFNYKDHIDMSDGIFIDDRSDILIRSNAVAKFELFNPYIFNVYDERDDKTTVIDWYSLVNILLPKSTQEGGILLEKFGGLLCQGV